MQVNISTRHGHLSQASQEKLTAKVEKLNRFYDRISAIAVTVDLENEDQPNVEIRVSAERIHDIVAQDKKGNLWSSVESAVHKVEQQIKRQKEKIQDHRVLGRRAVVDPELQDASDSAPEVEEA